MMDNSFLSRIIVHENQYCLPRYNCKASIVAMMASFNILILFVIYRVFPRSANVLITFVQRSHLKEELAILITMVLLERHNQYIYRFFSKRTVFALKIKKT